jgi:hypothetical protein
MRHKTKSKSKKQTKKLIKGRSRKSQRKHSGKSQRKHSRKSQRKHSRKQNGGECEYLKVQGFNLPDLKIPEQYGLLNESCQPSAPLGSNNAVLHGHPNMTT